jgi:hypothetical protein
MTVYLQTPFQFKKKNIYLYKQGVGYFFSQPWKAVLAKCNQPRKMQKTGRCRLLQNAT